MIEHPEGADRADALPLDPYGTDPDRASLIAGLGGTQPSPDPSYVFATADSRPAIGRVRATVRFHDLAITHGTLLFEVRVRSAVPGAAAERLKTVVVDAAELVAADGVVVLDFESYRNAYYSVACGINDATDIAATAISVAFDRRATVVEHGREWEWTTGVAGRRPGIETTLIGRVLTSRDVPRLEAPQSQVGSPLQCREAIFTDAMRALRRMPAGTFENWSLAYVLQAIARFSAKGARRMLGYGEDQATLLSYFAGQGCEVVGMRHAIDREIPLDPGQALQQLWVPELCDEADFFARTHYTAGDIRRPFGTFLDHFDVMWSIGCNRVMTPQDYIYFIVNGMVHVKPGGLAVHVFDYVEDEKEGQGDRLTRHDIERIAVMSLSWNHDVARLHFLHDTTLPEPGMTLPFGLVLLRGLN